MAVKWHEELKGQRITDYISFGVIEKAFPMKKVKEVLKKSGRASQRERDLPAHIMVYYAIALALYMGSSYREVLRSLLSGRNWLRGLSQRVRVVGKSGISQAQKSARPRSSEGSSRRVGGPDCDI